MSNTNVDMSKSVTVTTGGSYVVQTSGATFNQNGTIRTPVQYRYQPYAQSSQKITVYTEQRFSNATPGFNGPNRARLVKPLSFTYKKWQLKQSHGQTYQRRAGGATYAPIDDNYVDYPNTQVPIDGYAATATDIDVMDREAVIALRNKIKSMSFNAAQAFAERASTARTIADGAITIANAIRAVKRGDVGAAARALGVTKPRGRGKGSVADAATRHWLSLQYGWKPILNDVYGAAEQLARSQNNVQFRRVVTNKTINRERNIRQNMMTGDDVGFDVRITRVKEKVDLRYGVCFSQTSGSVTSAKQLGLTNPALVAWELVPFSFVADWFLPIGNYLSSLDATLGLTFVSGYRTTFRRVDGEEIWDTNRTSNRGTGTNMYRFIYNSWERIECVRTPLSGFPSTPLPPFKNPVSVTHAANAVSLLFQLFKR